MRTPTVHVFIGPPASGKSTMAKEWISKNENLVRLNRDDFRMSFFGKTILNRNDEKKLTSVIKTIATDYLKDGRDVILDNTHCNLETLKLVEEDYLDIANISYHTFNVDYPELIRRNAERVIPVPEDVILRMYQKYQHIYGSFNFATKSKRIIASQDYDKKKPDVYVFDIDRTLSEPYKRSVYDFLKAGSDIVIHGSMEILNAISKNYNILFVTGRSEYAREVTLKWLEDSVEDADVISNNFLFMRENGDNRSSKVVKEEILVNKLMSNYNILGWFDDDERVVEMLKLHGVQVYNTAQY